MDCVCMFLYQIHELLQMNYTNLKLTTKKNSQSQNFSLLKYKSAMELLVQTHICTHMQTHSSFCVYIYTLNANVKWHLDRIVLIPILHVYYHHVLHRYIHHCHCLWLFLIFKNILSLLLLLQQH